MALRYPYMALAMAVNTTGNSITSAGGCIMMVAGPSSLFTPVATCLAILIALATVTASMMFLGLQI